MIQILNKLETEVNFPPLIEAIYKNTANIILNDQKQDKEVHSHHFYSMYWVSYPGQLGKK